MENNPKAQTELFHLLFLREFSAQIAPQLYAIKGGCNLRFFFGSYRYSEDLDIDIQTVQTTTLENKVNKILRSISLKKMMAVYGVEIINSSGSKQTHTTQRWKIQLKTEHSLMPIQTKIEFSRRKKLFQGTLAPVTPSICQTHQLPPTSLMHYPVAAAMEQKISALAHRNATQARDVFDIYHLLHLKASSQIETNKTTLNKSIETLHSISFDDYKSQVVSFLEPEQQTTFGTKTMWSALISEINQYLERLSS